MTDPSRTNQELLEENTLLRQRIQELEHSDSERKCAEEALRETEERYRTLVENASDVVFRTDLNGHFTFANLAMLNITGYSEGEIIGKHYRTLVRPDKYREVMKVLVGQYESRERNTYHEFPIIRKDGHEKWIGQNTQLIMEGDNVNGFMAVARDITEMKQAEEALRESEEKYRSLVENISDVIYEIDSQGVVIYISPVVRDVMGYDQADIVGKNFIEFVYEDDRSHLIERFIEVRGGIESPSEYRLINKSGDIRWVRTKTSPIMESGSFKGARGTLIDITDSKQAEELLRLTRFSIEHASDALFWMTPDARIVDVNKAACRSLGYTREELLKLAVPDVDINYDAEKWPQHFAELRQCGSLKFESEQRTKDGRLIPVEIASNHVQFGAEERNCAFVRDITVRKQAEEALWESRQRFQGLVETLNDWIWEVDPQGHYTYVSPRIKDILGYEPEELLGKTPFEMMPTEEVQRVLGIFGSLTAEQKPIIDLENINLHKDGHPVVMETSGLPFYDSKGNFKGYRGTDRDITARKRVEEALQDSETRFRQLADLTWEGILIHRDSVVLDANRALFGMFGYETAEVIGRNVLDFIAPEYTETAMQKLKQGAEPSVLHFEGQGRKKDGTVFPIKTLGRPITHNNLPARVTAIRDLTERKQAEANKEKLEAQNRQLQKNESLGRMAGAIAHTFNNQLGVVIGNLEMAIGDLPQGAGPVNSLIAAMQAAGKAADVSGLMLTYLGQTPGKREPLDLSDVCLQNLPLLQTAIPKNVALEADLPTPGPTINANANQIQQVMTNLITNAWEAVGEDGGSIHLRIRTVSLTEIPIVHRNPIDWQPQDNAYACRRTMPMPAWK